MRNLLVVIGVLVLCINLPIWYFLLYRVLIATNANELSWFLYWIYVPVGLVGGAVSSAIKRVEDER